MNQVLTSPVTSPRMWPEESTNRGMTSISNSPKQRKESMGGGTISHTGKFGVLGTSIAEKI